MKNLFQIKNQTNLDTSQFETLANVFIPYHQQELQWKKPVNINLVSDEENSQNPLGKTAYYDPSTLEIVIYLDNRHVKDTLRSLSHELVHHLQNCKGTLTPMQEDDPQYAQNDENLRKCEEEAYLLGNMIFRDWEDQYKNSESLQEDFQKITKEKYQYLVTWHRNNEEDVYIVIYPEASKMPNDNDFKTSSKIYLKRLQPSFNAKGILTFWRLYPKVHFVPEILERGDLVPLAMIDHKIAGDYVQIARQPTIPQKQLSEIIKEAYANYSEGVPDDVEQKIIGTFSQEQSPENPNWIGSAKYGKNSIVQSYFWTHVGSSFFVVSEHSLYGTEVIDFNFSTKKEAREFGLKELQELEYEADIVTIKTYRDEVHHDFHSLKRKRRHHYESTQHARKDYDGTLLERVYKKFNIYHKGDG